jgi:adenylate cyclase
VGRLVLKGKTQPLMVYQPLLAAEGKQAQPDTDYQAAYHLMLKNAPLALNAFQRLASQRADDPLVILHLNRLQAGQSGDVIVFTEK